MGGRSYWCSVCGKGFGSYEELDGHEIKCYMNEPGRYIPRDAPVVIVNDQDEDKHATG